MAGPVIVDVARKLELSFGGGWGEQLLSRTEEAGLDRKVRAYSKVRDSKGDASAEPHAMRASLERLVLKRRRSNQVPQSRRLRVSAAPEPVVQRVRLFPAQIAQGAVNQVIGFN